MPINLTSFYRMVRDALPDTILVVSPDAYDAIVADLPNPMPGSDRITGVEGRHDVTVRCSTAVSSDTILHMNSASFQAPDDRWASQFLSKSGPSATGVVSPYVGKYVKPVGPKPPEPVSPQPEQPERVKPRPRQRIVDT